VRITPATLGTGLGTTDIPGVTIGDQQFTGGMRVFNSPDDVPRLWSTGRNASRPFAELLIDESEDRVHLRVRWRWLRWLVPEWSAPLDTLTCAPFGRSAMTSGVVLRSPGHVPAIFWCDERTRRIVLTTLAQRSHVAG
jgi:hypothetical protein